MNIQYQRGALEEKRAINNILQELRDNQPLCPTIASVGSLNQESSHYLMGNVTAALFTSMGVTPPVENPEALGGETLLMMYLRLLGFVYIYHFTVGSLAMFMFATFIGIIHKPVDVYKVTAISSRVIFGILLASLTSIIASYDKTYSFVTSPMIIFTFTLSLLGSM